MTIGEGILPSTTGIKNLKIHYNIFLSYKFVGSWQFATQFWLQYMFVSLMASSQKMFNISSYKYVNDIQMHTSIVLPTSVLLTAPASSMKI